MVPALEGERRQGELRGEEREGSKIGDSTRKSESGGKSVEGETRDKHQNWRDENKIQGKETIVKFLKTFLFKKF